MTVTLTSATRLAGAVQAAGTTHTLSADLEADLVRRKLATYSAAPSIGGVGAEVTANVDPVTGGIDLSAGAVTAAAALRLYCSSGIPFVLPSSGTINNTAGGVTVATAFDYVIGPSFTFFPAGALFASSPAGWYYTNWTAASIGTVYADTYTNGTPQIPSAPTALTTVAGAYTQTTALDLIGPNVVVPGNAMGNNGCIEWQRAVNNNNSAGAKVYNGLFGGMTFQGLSQTTNPKAAGAGSLKNRGRKTAQVAANAAYGDSGAASTINKLTVDTAENQVLSMSLKIAAATDYAIIESFAFKVFYG